jgi:uncharacterized protein (TIGR00369 family)
MARDREKPAGDLKLQEQTTGVSYGSLLASKRWQQRVARFALRVSGRYVYNTAAHANFIDRCRWRILLLRSIRIKRGPQMNDKPIAFKDQLEYVKWMYDQKIPFNRVLGFRAESLDSERVIVRFEMRDALMGNWILKTLHGGVISAVLDATGGLNASIGLLEKLQGLPVEAIERRMARVGTIDLRVDYLRPGRGTYFRANSKIMRAGNKVAVTRMELINDADVLIAVGTGTYLIG